MWQLGSGRVDHRLLRHFRSACNRTFVPAARSSGDAYSFTLSLMPSRHGTKIIAVGATFATCIAHAMLAAQIRDP